MNLDDRESGSSVFLEAVENIRERAPSTGPENRAHRRCYRRVANDLGRLAAEALSGRCREERVRC